MSSHGTPIPMTSHACGPLAGRAEVPGDKSISHRSLILGAMAVGETVITGLLEGDDVLDTARAMRSFGAEVTRDETGTWRVQGVGVGGFAEPDHVIDCGNSGTGVRLIMGAMATTDITVTFTGDASLNGRPMARVTDPLALFGTRAVGRAGGRLPMTLVGAAEPVPVRYTVPVPSAQVKSAVLLAGLNAPGQTVVIEQEATRDHTERMLAGFGAEIATQETEAGRVITLTGQPELRPQTIAVPRDPSSAAFPVCAALIVPGSDVLVPGIGLNPTRAGLFTTLQEMGADLTFENFREEGGEPVADLRARYSPEMRGIDVPPERAASMIDEYPVLSVVAANATGRTMMTGVRELRVKESDRIDAMATGLRAAGVAVEEGPDWWSVAGCGAGGVAGGITAASHLDHRIAMSFLILGMAARAPVSVDDGGPITTSFPIFEDLMGALGANLRRAAADARGCCMSMARARLFVGLAAALCFAALFYLTRAYLSPGDMTIFDSHVFGYDLNDARAYIGALGTIEKAVYTGPYRVLDTLFPVLLAVFLAMLLHDRSRGWSVVAQLMLLILPGGYLVMDLAENALVAQLLQSDLSDLRAESVNLASRFTVMKYAMLGATGAALVAVQALGEARMTPFTIAVDGPAASGKGTISRALAETFGIAHLDTGLLYRAVGRAALQGTDPVGAARDLTPGDLSDEEALRSGDVAQQASRVAAIPEVRAALLDFQRAFARRSGGAVLDGRDIGTVICPQAEVKLFVTASAEVRAERRFLELSAKGHDVTREGVLEDVRARDARDMNRADAPLKAGPDAVTLDTTEMDIADAVARAIAEARPAFDAARGPRRGMRFAALRLPPEMARDSLLDAKYHTEGYLDALDRETLWYDAVWRDGVIHLVCPPLGRWRKAMRRARFRGDGVPLEVRRLRRYKRHDVVEVSAPSRPARLSVYLDAWRGESAVSAAEPGRFAGRNTMFYVSRDNDLRWLVAHARYHRRVHRAEALIVMDNMSETYAPDEIAAALAPVGLEVLVLPAPFKYGPVGLPPYRRLEKFMQTALFNVLRLRFLGGCRAILSCDVDEMVLSEGGSVFDAAVASRLGFVQIRGQWHSPAPGSEGPYTHADHLWVEQPPKSCPPKWCLRPDGPLGGWSWDVHGIERLPLLHARTVPGFRFAHCRGVSTGWKKQGRLVALEGTVRDPLAAACLAGAGPL